MLTAAVVDVRYSTVVASAVVAVVVVVVAVVAVAVAVAVAAVVIGNGPERPLPLSEERNYCAIAVVVQ